MKTLIVALVLSLIAASGILTVAVSSVTSSVFAADRGVNTPAQAAATDAPAVARTIVPQGAAQSSSAAENLTENGTRGQLEDLMSLCDVAPPCPSGCTADAVSHKCVEWQGP